MTTASEAKIRRHLTGLIGAVDNGNVAIGPAVEEILATYMMFNKADPAVTVMPPTGRDGGRVDRYLGATSVRHGDDGELYVSNPDGKLAALYPRHEWGAAIDSTYVSGDAALAGA